MPDEVPGDGLEHGPGDGVEGAVAEGPDALETLISSLRRREPTPDQIRHVYDVIDAPDSGGGDSGGDGTAGDAEPGVNEPYVLDDSSQSLLDRVRARKEKLTRGI